MNLATCQYSAALTSQMYPQPLVLIQQQKSVEGKGELKEDKKTPTFSS